MTDEEIKAYVAAQIEAMKSGMIDIGALPVGEADSGTTLPVVKDGQLRSVSVDDLRGEREGVSWYEGG